MTSSKPYQYIKGWVEFYKLKFKITPDVLIPRPETELLVDEVIAYAKHNNHPALTILDLGTGSGNIAISLACNLKGCSVNIIATDISQKALKIAQKNAKLHGVEDKITFIKSNLLDVIASTAKQSSTENSKIATSFVPLTPRNDARVDIIVTNLPYIPSARIPYLDCSVKDFEPLVALDGGEDGFKLYRKLFKQIAEKNLQPKLIIGEIDYTQGELAVSEALKYFPGYQAEVKLDLTHKQRILIIQKSITCH